MLSRVALAVVISLSCVAVAAAPVRAQPGQPAGSDMRAIYDDAFAAMIEGDYRAAVRGFDAVAAGSNDPDLRAAARELGRLATALESRGARVGGVVPGAPTPAQRDVEDQDQGRTSVIVTSTITGFYSGFVLLDLMDVDDFRTGILVVTGSTALGFGGSLLATRDRTITGGMGDAFTLGLGLGLGNGLLLSIPLDITSSEGVELMALGGMALGAGIGITLADRVRPTRGQVGFVTTMSTLGVATTALGLAVVQPDDLDSDSFALLMLGGLDGGAALGLTFADRIDWSSSRARLVNLGLFLGGLGGWAVAALTTGANDLSDNDARLWAGSALGGMWAGFGLAAHFTRHMDPDPRFTKPSALDNAVVTPTAMPGGGGLSISGSW